MLGSTHSKNSDKFAVLNLLNNQKMYGVDIHANTLMSILYFNGQLKPISLWFGVIIVFI